MCSEVAWSESKRLQVDVRKNHSELSGKPLRLIVARKTLSRFSSSCCQQIRSKSQENVDGRLEILSVDMSRVFGFEPFPAGVTLLSGDVERGRRPRGRQRESPCGEGTRVQSCKFSPCSSMTELHIAKKTTTILQTPLKSQSIASMAERLSQSLVFRVLLESAEHIDS